jgi:crotonobetainyl-CoA:carnitine CoA-transferase CaiB-like acyl-CoA transferase
MPGADDPLLAGLTVLDFTRVLAGPYCTRLLSDLGARVIKIERPGEGDDTRRGHAQMEPGRTDQGTYFIRINAGKSSLALDLSHPKAREVIVDLARASDVVVENFLPGVVAKLGCDYAALSAVKSDLVYCSISGFGQSGPLRLQPAFHHIVNAMSGIMYLEQQTDPAPRPGYLQAADVLAGTHAFGAILAALWRRSRTGRGAYLDVSMLECMVGAEDINYGGMLNAGAEYPGPRPGMIVHGIGGRHVAMQTVGAPQLWPRLVAMMDRPDLAADERFATPAGRRDNWAALHPIICAWLDRFKTVEEAVKALTGARVPAGRGHRPPTPDGAPGVSRDRAPRPRQGADHGRAVPRRQSAGDAARRRPVSSRRAHARGPRRRARLLEGTHRGAAPAQGDRHGVTSLCR